MSGETVGRRMTLAEIERGGFLIPLPDLIDDFWDRPQGSPIDEKILAATLLICCQHIPYPGIRLLLKVLAAALENSGYNFGIRLRLVQPKGRPRDDDSRERRAWDVGETVKQELAQGHKKEAAIAAAQSKFGLSRAAVIRALNDHKEFEAATEKLAGDLGRRITWRPQKSAKS